MPSADTFDIKPIGDFVRKYLVQSKISIDPFARNKRWATYTNDLNPNTLAECHVTALEFLGDLKRKGIKTDLIIFDPPYTHYQMKQCYEGIGLEFTSSDAQQVQRWTAEKDLCSELLVANGTFLHFGHHSNGLGKNRGAKIIEILMVSHGSAHNDTICIAERRIREPQIKMALPLVPA